MTHLEQTESFTPAVTNPLSTAEVSPILERRMLPDVAIDTSARVGGRLDHVGMSGVEVALRRTDEAGQAVLTPARADAFVSLDDEQTKGIHMSRLFLVLNQLLDTRTFDLPVIEALLESFIDTHAKISRSSYLKFSFEDLHRRSALLSEHSGWRSYPVEVESFHRDGRVEHRLEVRVTYSSACPCSAALARQLLLERFQKEFHGHRWVSVAQVAQWLTGDESLHAIPHSQRSHADVTIVLTDDCRSLPTVELVDRIESSLSTPVQTAVKRADEQEFARLNGDNLMFCEDAARRIKAAMDAMPQASDYRIEVQHLESLHPHDAVAKVVKGVEGGLTV